MHIYSESHRNTFGIYLNNNGTQKKMWSVLGTRPMYYYIFWRAESESEVGFVQTPLKFFLNREKPWKIAENSENSHRKDIGYEQEIFLWVYYTWFLCILTRWNRIRGLFCPSTYEKLVKNCENTKKITENHENSHERA